MRGTADECVKDTGIPCLWRFFAFTAEKLGLLAGIASKGIKRTRLFCLFFHRVPPPGIGGDVMSIRGCSMPGITRTGNAYLTVDIHEFQETINEMRNVLTRDKFLRLMGRTFAEVERKAKTLIAREVTTKYAVPQYWVKNHIGRGRVNVGVDVQCVIPLSGERGLIGPRFKAKALKRGRVRATILKGRSNLLPKTMDHQGGNPPFIAGGVTYTRKTSEPKPIVRVAGLSAAQMPLNRSADAIADQLVMQLGNRLEHNFTRMFGGK